MKTILSKIKIHPLFLIFIIIFILIGRFKLIMYFTLLILVHESGHIIVSLLFKWNIDKIIILPFGGMIKYNELINRKLLEEFLIAISGVIFQYIFFLIFKNIVNYKYFSFINYFIIIFNLIPIYPLDGSKILNVLFNKITTFKNSILLTLITSYILILMLTFVLFSINKLGILIIYILFKETTKLYNEKEVIFNKFLLERNLYEFKFKRKKTINSIYQMKKNYKHLFKINNKYITEKYYLKKMFDINS